MQELHNIQELDFGTLVLALYCFCGDKKIKYGLLSNNMVATEKDFRITINFYKKLYLPVIT